MAKKAKAITGAQGQTTAVQADVQVSAVNKPRAELGFVDYKKSRDTVIKGEFVIRGILVGESKKRHWMLSTYKADGTKGKIIGYFGDRKDLKGVYCRSEILSICSEPKAVATETVEV